MSDGAGGRQVVSGDELRLLAERAGQSSADVTALRHRVQDLVNGVDRRGWNAGAFEDQWARTRFSLIGLSDEVADNHAELLTRAGEADQLNTPRDSASDPVFKAPMAPAMRPFSQWSVEQKIEFALRRAFARLPEELRRQLEALLSPQAIALMVAVLGLWLIGHAFGYGEAADVGVFLFALATLGPEAFRFGGETGQFFTGLAAAHTESEADAASQHLATALSILGVDGVMALVAHSTSIVAKGALPEVRTRPPASREAVAVTADGTQVRVSVPDESPIGNDVLEMAGGENRYTADGKRIHKEWSDRLREDGTADDVGRPIQDATGADIEVPYKVNLRTGETPVDGTTQVAIPDAVVFKEGRIIDLKPANRPISKDRQEMIRFINAYKLREGKLPEIIEIQRYDRETGLVILVERYKPSYFLPPDSTPPLPPEGLTP